MQKADVEKLKQASNIWAMLAAASFAAAFFSGFWFWGLLLGAFSVHMSMKLIDYWVEAEKERKQ